MVPILEPNAWPQPCLPQNGDIRPDTSAALKV